MLILKRKATRLPLPGRFSFIAPVPALGLSILHSEPYLTGVVPGVIQPARENPRLSSGG